MNLANCTVLSYLCRQCLHVQVGKKAFWAGVLLCSIFFTNNMKCTFQPSLTVLQSIVTCLSSFTNYLLTYINSYLLAYIKFLRYETLVAVWSIIIDNMCVHMEHKIQHSIAICSLPKLLVFIVT